MERAQIYFGRPFEGSAYTHLRERLCALAPQASGRLHIDTVLHRYQMLQRGAERSVGTPTWYLLLDLYRFVLFRPQRMPQSPGVDSVVRCLIDAYPHQPVHLIAEYAQVTGRHFLYSLATLDLLHELWPYCRPGAVLVVKPFGIEVEVLSAWLHPESREARESPLLGGACPGTGWSSGQIPEPLRLGDSWTDASLRIRRAPTSSDFGSYGQLSSALGPLRELALVRDKTSLPWTTVRITWDQGRQEAQGFAKSTRAKEAVGVAMAEAVERFHIAFPRPGEVLTRGSYADLAESAIDPRDLFFDGPSTVPSESSHRYHDSAEMYWAWVSDVTHCREVLVPAQEIWYTDRLAGEQQFIKPTTNACAVGASVEEAALFALLEAIERDALLTTWYLRRQCAAIDLESIQSESFHLLRFRWKTAFKNYDFTLFDITTDVAVPSVAGLAVKRHGDGPKLFLTTATRLSAERACLAALMGLTNFTPRCSEAQRQRSAELLCDPNKVVTVDDHFAFYSADESFDRLAFLHGDAKSSLVPVASINQRCPIPLTDRYNLRDVIEALAMQLSRCGASVLLKDITHIPLAIRGMRCVKAVTPGLFPLWIGAQHKRFSVTDRLRRLSRDLTGHSTEPGDFNLDIHPLT